MVKGVIIIIVIFVFFGAGLHHNALKQRYWALSSLVTFIHLIDLITATFLNLL